LIDETWRRLWGFTRQTLYLAIYGGYSYISAEEREKISQLPYDALDALLNDIFNSDIYAKFNGKPADGITEKDKERIHKDLINSYINSSYVTATLDNGEVMRGRITPASSGERVFIDYKGNKWDLSKFISMDPPLDEGGNKWLKS